MKLKEVYEVIKNNYLTLQPNDRTDQKLFYKFRVNSMWNTFVIYLCMTVVVWLLTLIIELVNHNESNLGNFLGASGVLVILIIIFLVTRKWRHTLVYLLGFYFLIINLV